MPLLEALSRARESGAGLHLFNIWTAGPRYRSPTGEKHSLLTQEAVKQLGQGHKRDLLGTRCSASGLGSSRTRGSGHSRRFFHGFLALSLPL